MQKWLQEHVLDFIGADDWPSSSTDFNPLDYKLWSVLEKCARAWRHQNLDSLKAEIVKATRKISLAVIRKLIDDWPKRYFQLIFLQKFYSDCYAYLYVP